MADLAVGSTFAGYEVVSLIGRGAMGAVYRVHDPNLDRDVALKVMADQLAQDPAFRARFSQEAKTAARVNHPSIVPIYEAGEEGGVSFLVMRLVPGKGLADQLATGPLPAQQALALLLPIAEGLVVAHAAGIVHRDVKPANIMVPDDGSPPVLIDFGIGRDAHSTGATQVGSWVGTVDYAAPEQIRGGAVDGRTDQYALACVLFELLTGVPPFHRPDTVQTLFAHANDAPPTLGPTAGVDGAALGQAIERALAKEPAERFASCADFLRAAAGVSAPAPAPAPPAAAAATARSSTVIADAVPTPTGGGTAAAVQLAPVKAKSTLLRYVLIVVGALVGLLAVSVVLVVLLVDDPPATITPAALAAALSNGLVDSAGNAYPPVACPAPLEAVVGATETCVLSDADGSEWNVAITITKVKADGTWKFSFKVADQANG